jgi:hypothetical protein
VNAAVSRTGWSMVALTGVISATTALAGGAPSSGAQQTGQWALRATRPQIISRLSATAPNAGTSLDIVQFRRGSGAVITNYALDNTQYMHLIVVRADFREFMHLHPLLHAGHFKLLVALSGGQRYYAFADSTPVGLGQQVVRFTLKAGEPPPVLATKVAASLPAIAAGPYIVRIARTFVPAGRAFALTASITKHGRFAKDLQPYLGAAAHVVLIATSDLSYLHVHPLATGQPMAMSATNMAMPSVANGPVAPRMQLEIPALTHPGAYKMWLQFRGGGSLYVAPFTLVAR